MEIRQKSWLLPFMWIHAVLLLAGLYPLMAEALNLGGKETIKFTMTAFTLLVPVGVSWFLIRLVRALWQYLILAVIVVWITGKLAELICPYLVSGTGIALDAKILTILISATIFLIRASARIRKGRMLRDMRQMPGNEEGDMFQRGWELPTFLDMPHPAQWIWYAAQYLFGLFVKNQTYYRIIFWLLFADIFLCLLCSYTERVRSFIKEHSRIANLPVETILRLRWMILRIVLFGLLLFMLPAALYNREPMEGIIANLLEPKNEQMDTAMQEGEQGEEMLIDLSEFTQSDQPTLPEWLMKILHIVWKVLDYILTIFCFYWILRFISRMLGDSSRDFAVPGEDEVIFIEKSEEENRFFTLKKLSGKDGLFSPNMRIRRQYRRLINKSIDERPKGHETPTELEETAGLIGTEGMGRLHVYYEKARYSKEGCTKEEVEMLRKG